MVQRKEEGQWLGEEGIQVRKTFPRNEDFEYVFKLERMDLVKRGEMKDEKG